ncbi:hypothetical protein KP509_02G101100 [Ceratopteris richardii]|nr:hypothetical protein KP509_02G101100 [Ceratopteris richardii]KAH7444990.1 hypothetical protein KP509_02G101100 [Ceratopteris richardii]
MDSNIWQKLPNHILYHIALFLPFWAIIRLRGVSRELKKYFGSKEFLVDWGRKSHQEVLFFIVTDSLPRQAVAAFSPALNKWHRLTLSDFSNNAELHRFHVLTASGGLLCMEKVEWPNQSLIICNPVNRSYRKLPPVPDMQSAYIVGMAVNADKSGYKVLVVQDGDKLVSQFYDSLCDSWIMGSSTLPGVSMLTDAVSIEGSMFCLSLPSSILIRYDTEAAEWFDTEVRMPSSMCSPYLIQMAGSLFLVGGVLESGEMSCVKIWKVDLSLKECVEIQQMPANLFQNFSWNISPHDFSCMGEAGFMCFWNVLTGAMLMFNMNGNRWWWAPSCPITCSSPKCTTNNVHNVYNSSRFVLRPCLFVKA